MVRHSGASKCSAKKSSRRITSASECLAATKLPQQRLRLSPATFEVACFRSGGPTYPMPVAICRASSPDEMRHFRTFGSGYRIAQIEHQHGPAEHIPQGFQNRVRLRQSQWLIRSLSSGCEPRYGCIEVSSFACRYVSIRCLVFSGLWRQRDSSAPAGTVATEIYNV